MFHSLSRTHLFFLAVSLLVLRIAVGAHFFNEGITKIRTGDFTSKYFLAEAKGPLADFFRGYLDDADGIIRLCLKTENPLAATSEEFQSPQISPEFSFMIWNDFADRVKSYYGLNQAELQKQLESQIEKSKASLRQFPEEPLRQESLARLIAVNESQLREAPFQGDKVDAILAEHKELLEEFLAENRSELLAYFGTKDRLQGFARDGQQRHAVSTQVASLRDQVDSIKYDRQQKFQGWISEVESIWNSLETQLNGVADQFSLNKSPLLLHRPFDQPYSWQKVIDLTLPWFDTLIGILLILGLFTRFASLAAALFLASIVATQPPWIPGTAPTSLYIVEMTACLVLCAGAAGRFGGLDFFFTRQPKPVALNVPAGNPSSV